MSKRGGEGAGRKGVAMPDEHASSGSRAAALDGLAEISKLRQTDRT